MIVILKCFLIQNRIYFIFSELNVCEIKLYKEQNKRNSVDNTMKKDAIVKVMMILHVNVQLLLQKDSFQFK